MSHTREISLQRLLDIRKAQRWMYYSCFMAGVLVAVVAAMALGAR